MIFEIILLTIAGVFIYAAISETYKFRNENKKEGWIKDRFYGNPIKKSEHKKINK